LNSAKKMKKPNGMSEKYYLNGEWKFKLGNIHSDLTPKEIRNKKWMNAEVPGAVHTDLLKNKLIDNPFYSNNETKLGWIAESDWIYKTVFDLPFEPGNPLPVKLVFDGLDTISKIFLNGICLGGSKNMFLKYEFDVSNYLKPRKNELEIFFESPVNYSIEEENKYGKLPVALESHRVYIRKAQYSFGWDWGPSFPTMGIWRNVYLEKENPALITDIRFNTQEILDDVALVEILFNTKKNSKETITAKVNLSFGDSCFTKQIELADGENRVQLDIEKPSLWMPNGYGNQSLYDLEIILEDKSNRIVNPLNKKVGIRKIELQLEEGGKNTFRFIVNGKKIYAKGVNWIPGDAFLPRVKKDKYCALLSYAREANMNLIRVWGGGIYEDDLFYDLCDEIGLLVWQDFMFACGAYPEHDEFIENIKEEFLYNIKRLQYHPSIAIWCGNNENEWIWYQRQKTNYKMMPGYKIYHEILPALLKELDPLRSYWPSSPFGFDEDPDSQTSGNRHQWDVWSRWIDYNEVVSDRSLFITEFGFQGPANKTTFEKFIPKKDRKFNGEIFEFHNKQIEGPERVNRFLTAHLPLSTKWDEYIYLAQLNQGLALKTCLEHWRFNQPETNGSIIWQINDTWPVTSWALIDSELKPKLAYHFVKNSFSPIALKFLTYNDRIELMALNQTDEDAKCVLQINLFSSHNGKIILNEKSPVKLAKESINCIRVLKKEYDRTDLLIATLFDEEGSQIHRNLLQFKEWKYLKLPKAKIKIKISKKEKEQTVTISSDKPAFYVDLISSLAVFSNRGMILLPGERCKVKIEPGTKNNLETTDINIFALNQFLCG
jgi:beta-mannosidase